MHLVQVSREARSIITKRKKNHSDITFLGCVASETGVVTGQRRLWTGIQLASYLVTRTLKDNSFQQ